MLDLIHNKMKGWVTWVIIIIMSAVFVFSGISYFLASGSVSAQNVAKIGDVSISSYQFQQIVSQNNAISNAAKLKILDQLIDQELFRQDSINNNLIVTPDSIQNIVFNYPQFMVDGRYSQERFDAYAQANGGAARIESIIASNLLPNLFRGPLASTNFALKNEVQSYSNLIMQERNVDVYNFDIAKYKKNITIKSNDIKNYYIKNENEFMNPATISFKYANINTSQFMPKHKLNPEDIKQYYKNNRSDFINPYSKSGDLIKVKNPKLKNEIINKVTKNIAFSSKDLKNITITHFNNVIAKNTNSDTENKLLELNEINQIKNITASSFIVLKKISPNSQMTFIQSEPTIKKILTNRQAMLTYQKVLSSINLNNMDELVNKYKLKAKSIVNFSKDNKNNISINNKLTGLLFSKNQSKTGFLVTGDTSAIIYQITSSKPAKQKPLSEVINKVKNILAKNYAIKEININSKKIIKELNSGKLKVSDIESKYYLLHKNIKLKRNDTKLNPNYIKSIFSAKLGEYNISKSLDIPIIFTVKNISKKAASDIPKSEIQQVYSSMESSAYTQSLKNSISVKINHNLVHE